MPFGDPREILWCFGDRQADGGNWGRIEGSGSSCRWAISDKHHLKEGYSRRGGCRSKTGEDECGGNNGKSLTLGRLTGKEGDETEKLGWFSSGPWGSSP